MSDGMDVPVRSMAGVKTTHTIHEGLYLLSMRYAGFLGVRHADADQPMTTGQIGRTSTLSSNGECKCAVIGDRVGHTRVHCKSGNR